MTFWREAGLNYIQYSNIAAKMLRRSLKVEFRKDSGKAGVESTVKFTQWNDGKPVKSENK